MTELLYIYVHIIIYSACLIVLCSRSLLLCVYAVCKVLCFILSDDDFEIKSKIYSFTFIHILNCKMTLFIFS